MKKMLVILCFFILFSYSNTAYGLSNIYYEANTEDQDTLTLTNISQNGLKLHVVKDGENPFKVTFGNDYEYYYPKEFFETDDAFIVYGEYLVNRNYNGFILKLSKTGEVLNSLKYEDNLLENVIWGIATPDGYIFYIEQTKDINDYYYFTKGTVLKTDQDLNIIKKIDYNLEIKCFNYVNNQYIFSKNYLATANIVLNNDLEAESLNIKDEYINDSFSFDFIGDATLNGEKYLPNEIINVPGKYELHIKNGKFEFNKTIYLEPKVYGINDGLETKTGVRIYSNAQAMKLNGEDFLGYIEISTPNDYELELICANGYKKLYNFSILPTVKNLSSNKIYYNEHTLEFTGTGYLNDKIIESGTKITEAGDYNFKLYKGEYLVEDIDFSLAKTKTDNKFKSIALDLVLGVMTISGAILVFKKYK